MTVEHGLKHLEVLSRRYSISILKFMLNNGPEVKYSDLGGIITTFNTLSDLMQELESAGLVSTRRVMKPYKTNYARLTPLGIRVAQKLQDIEDLMNGLEPEAETSNHSAPAAEGDHARP